MKFAVKLGAVLLAGALCSGPADAGMVLAGAPSAATGPPAGGTATLSMTGTGLSGSSLACSSSGWTQSPTGFTYQFLRDGAAISGATSTPYTAVTADQGHSITCSVTASNSFGSSASPAVSGPQAVASCSQSASWFARVWALPATLNQTHVGAYDTMVCGIVTDGIWPAFANDALWVPATNDATSTPATAQKIANMNLASANYTLVPHGATFVADQGYGGGTDGGTTVYVDTGYNPSTATGAAYTLNSAHAMAWTVVSITAKSAGYAQILGGLGPAGNGTAILPWVTSGDMIASTNYTSNTSQYAVSAGPWGGGLMVSRTGSATEALYRNGAVLTPLAFGPYAAVGIPNANMYLLAGNNNNTGIQNGSAYQVAAASFGSGLLAAQISSSGGTTGTGLMPRICAYLIAVHTSC